MGYQTTRVTKYVARKETPIIVRSGDTYLRLARLARIVSDARILIHSDDFRVVHFA